MRTDHCIHHFVEAQTLRTPDAVALVFGNERLTYRELNGWANQLARNLQNLGVRPEMLVGICVERSVDMIVGIIGILKAGGAYVPLDPAYPAERIEFMLSDSDVSILVVQEELGSGLIDYQGTIVRLEGDADRIAQESDENPVSTVNPDNLAYVIYTSGSTGKPKGVMITHRNLANYVRSLPVALGLNVSDRYLHTASISFSSSVRQMMIPLSIGASVVIAASEDIRDPLSLFHLIRRENVTVLDFVPSYWRSCLLALNSTSKENEARLMDNKVRLVLSASEPLPVSIPRELVGKFKSGTCLINMYGQTETSGIISVHPINADLLEANGIVSVGQGITNAKTYIVDEEMKLVPKGEAGELCIGGPGVGRGYLNSTDLTADRFKKDPFDDGENRRLYKTGDLARYHPSGDIEFMGRADNQVKVRGFRVELGEIEAVLTAHPGINEAVVVAREEQSGEKRLAAYFVPGEGQHIGAAELRDHLRLKLPDYMIPSAYVALSDLPLTPNGKLDRIALPAPSEVVSESEKNYVAQRDTIEARLVEIWEPLLGVTPIGINDKFFDLGGDSLLAIRMFSSVEETFRKNIPIATLFEAGTIEKLADIIRQDGWAAPESSIVPIKPNGTKPPFFCIHAGGGNVLFYNDLARYVPDDLPFYGIRARRLGGRQVGHATFEEMAEFYISELRTLQPEGPYFLGGSSLGGMIGLEMAQQLRSNGQEVAFLALFDTWAPGYMDLLPNVSSFRSKIYDLAHRAHKHGDKLRVLDFRKKAEYFLNIAIKLHARGKRKIRNSYKKVVRRFYSKVERPIPRDYIQIEDQIHKAWLRYVPKKYEGKMTLFRACDQPFGIKPDQTLGWDGFAAGGMEIHEVPGDHVTLLAEPHVRILAERLNECILTAQAEQDSLIKKSTSAESATGGFVGAAGLRRIS